MPRSKQLVQLAGLRLDPLHVGHVPPLFGDLVAGLHGGDLLGQVGDARAQLAGLARQLPPQRLVVRLLVAGQQILQPRVRVGQLLAEAGRDPPAARARSGRPGATRRSPARQSAWSPRPPDGRGRRRLCHGPPASAAASARSPRSSRSAMPASAARIVLPRPPSRRSSSRRRPSKRQVRLLGGVHGGDVRHPPLGRLGGGASLRPWRPIPAARPDRSPAARAGRAAARCGRRSRRAGFE